MKRVLKSLFFPLVGILSLLWFLIRVIPKPSRAAYPCMKAAAPVASSFVLYVFGFLASIFVFKKAKHFLQQSRYMLFGITFLFGIAFGLSSFLQTDKPAYALVQSPPDGPNQPMGQGIGIFPGRVVWIHNPDATDETCRNRSNDYWSSDENTDQAQVNAMLSQALHKLTEKADDKTAWDALFHNFNQTHGKGDVGYQTAEKIVIKINLNSNGCTGDDFERWKLKTVDTSPQIVYAILEQLVNKAGVPQSNIGIGDPGRNVDNLIWDKCHTEFPDVHYWGNGNGRTRITKTKDYAIFTSDGSMNDWLPKCYVEADYMINIPVFKKHHRAGISLSSKNHFGTFVPFRGSAFHWHFSLPAADGGGDVNNGDYGLYRCFVDIMGHKDIGGKTILYLIDGLWGSTNWAHPPIKWRMEPFNNDWPSSIFLSQDPVAIESVGYDFLFEEFGPDHPTEGDYDPSDHKGPFPHYAGVDDFLHQAADSKNWPQDFTYDPENDGTPLPTSMGVHEHWNNPVDKQYSRNLGADSGIELVSYLNTHVRNRPQVPVVQEFALLKNYPNPFNPTTTISYDIASPATVQLTIYNVMGQPIRILVQQTQPSGHYVVQWDGRLSDGRAAASGVYVYELVAQNDVETIRFAQKMVLNR